MERDLRATRGGLSPSTKENIMRKRLTVLLLALLCLTATMGGGIECNDDDDDDCEVFCFDD